MVVKSSLAKILAKGSFDNQTIRYIINKNHTGTIFNQNDMVIKFYLFMKEII